jgi:hypothetical protein
VRAQQEDREANGALYHGRVGLSRDLLIQIVDKSLCIFKTAGSFIQSLLPASYPVCVAIPGIRVNY